MWESLVLLFQEMGIAAGICLGLGLICIIIEMFQPGFGLFGTLGIILTIVGMALRVADSGSGNPIVLFLLMLLLVGLILTGAFLIMVKSFKYGKLSRSPLVDNSTAVGKERSDATKDFSALIGLNGVAVTPLRPVGTANIAGQIYDVTAETFYIDKNEILTVTAVEGVKITVRKAI